MVPVPPPFDAKGAIERVIREDWGRILAVLTRSLGDFQLAEDCAQDAVEAAMKHWGRNGLPAAPSAWLLTTARRRAIDQFRRDKTLAAKMADLAYLEEIETQIVESPENGHIPDKRLEMVFTCCHPAIEEKTRVALTLRTLGGLTTEQIASAFLDKPATMAQRLARARAKITKAGIPYKIPDPADMPERLSGVMRVIYLIFNAGYSASSDQQSDLSAEAIRLARILTNLMPEADELRGLLALMLLSDARSMARIDTDGNFVPLEAQNRNRWKKPQITEGCALLADLPMSGPISGPYQVQAAISAQHATSPTWAATDWFQIAGLYARLSALEPNPVVSINHAVALAYCGAPNEAKLILRGLEATPGIDTYQPFFAARAEVHKLLGEKARARSDLSRAIELCQTKAEKRFLQLRRDAL